MRKGEVKPAKTVKAGCGIRFDPDELGEETGFDFSGVQELLQPEEASDSPNEGTDAEAANPAEHSSVTPGPPHKGGE